MQNFIKLFYGLLFISMCSSNSADTVDTVRPASKNETVISTPAENSASKPPASIAVEGGNLPLSADHDETHLGREHIIEKSTELPKPFNDTANKTVDIVIAKPVTERIQEIDSGISRKNDNTKVVAKKGAPVENSTSEITNTSIKINVTATTTTTTVLPNSTSVIKPKKPTITEHADGSLALSEAKYNKSDVHASKAYNLDSILEKKSNRADYVIPIVAVILSVPLVAIIISAVYKRGTYWWQHRNYRRMDFLIEGMYNN